jgi:GAF domain-containing protein
MKTESASSECPESWKAADHDVAADDLLTSVTELQNLLLETEDVQEFLQGMVGLAARLVAGGLSCGMTLTADGRPLTAACSDEIASQVDEVQYVLDEGPCPEALRERHGVRVHDTADEIRWPGFAAHAAAYGIRSCASLPLMVDGQLLGALNFYSRAPGAFGSAETERAENFARNASAALAVATRLAAYSALTDQLRASLATRAVIDQAMGVIMAKESCTQAEAFRILRTASQKRNLKLREIAGKIVSSVSGEQPQPPPFNGI